MPIPQQESGTSDSADKGWLTIEKFVPKYDYCGSLSSPKLSSFPNVETVQ